MKIEALYSPITVEANEWESLATVASRMRFNDAGSAAVLLEGELVGIITERDLTRAIADGVDTRKTCVGDYMTPDPMTVGKETDAREAARMMVDSGIRHLPVVDEKGTLLGLTSIRDIVIELIWSPDRI